MMLMCRTFHKLVFGINAMTKHQKSVEKVKFHDVVNAPQLHCYLKKYVSFLPADSHQITTTYFQAADINVVGQNEMRWQAWGEWERNLF